MLNPSFPWLWQASINILAIKSKRLHVIDGRSLLQPGRDRICSWWKQNAQCCAISHVKCTQQQPAAQNSCWSSGCLVRAWWTDVVPWLGRFVTDYLLSAFLCFLFPSSQPSVTQADKILFENGKWLLEKKIVNWKECLIFAFYNCVCRDSDCCLF